MQMGREFFGSDTEAEEVVQETWLRAWETGNFWFILIEKGREKKG